MIKFSMFKRWMNKRVIVLCVGVLAIAALAALSAGLASFEFDPVNVRSFRFYQSSGAVQTGGGVTQDLSWVRNLILFLSALFITAFIIALFNPTLRKWLLKQLPSLLVILVLAFMFARMRQLAQPPAQPEPQSAGAQTPLPAIDEGYIPPQVSLVGAYLVALAVLLIVMGGLYYWWLHRPVREAGSSAPLQELSEIVQAALDDLDAGRDWEDAIIQCYVRMSETVNIERGLLRRQAMTPSEFAARLIKAGLPVSAVQRLTQLFEGVRYGGKQSSRADVDEAVACLRVVVAACRGTT